MNKTLLIIGVIVLVLGILAQIYSVTTTEDYVFGLFTKSITSQPYDYLAIPLIVGGAVLIIVGLAVRGNSEKR
ncbi:MAG: hypothetical protein NTX24_00900 [Candidatus Pacearchaeota archaeon]|nr:hypothetical protein [Candidatus Pacearchaeota archaeon]